MPENKGVNPSALEKKGGYSGGRPATQVGRPAKVPSGAIRSATSSNGQASGGGSSSGTGSGSSGGTASGGEG